jgi:hypothetical protein
MIKRKLSKPWKTAVRALPLAAAAAASLLPLHRFGQQFVVLIVLVWAQVFFVLEIFLAGR